MPAKRPAKQLRSVARLQRFLKKKMTVGDRADLYNPPVAHKKEIDALRKSLRWAMTRYVKRVHWCNCCDRPRSYLPVTHKPRCPYAIARKLAGLSAKVEVKP